MAEKVQKTDQEWKAELTPEQYRVLRGKATERAFTGAYYATKEPGTSTTCVTPSRSRSGRTGNLV